MAFTRKINKYIYMTPKKYIYFNVKISAYIIYSYTFGSSLKFSVDNPLQSLTEVFYGNFQS
jgi:hypothetical protein